MEASVQMRFVLVTFSIICACAMAMPTVETGNDLGQRRRDPTQSRSWSGILRGPRRTSVPSRFDTQRSDLNRNPTYYNYHTLPEDNVDDIRPSVRDSNSRQRRSPQGFRSWGRLDGIDASEDIFRPPSFRDEQPRQPERTRFSDFSRSGCIDGGPSCTPKPQRKYFDFYS